MLAVIAVGVGRRADFLQSRLGKRPFGPKRLPRLQLDCAECRFFAIAAELSEKITIFALVGALCLCCISPALHIR